MNTVLPRRHVIPPQPAPPEPRTPAPAATRSVRWALSMFGLDDWTRVTTATGRTGTVRKRSGVSTAHGVKYVRWALVLDDRPATLYALDELPAEWFPFTAPPRREGHRDA